MSDRIYGQRVTKIAVPAPLTTRAWPVSAASDFGLTYEWTRRREFARPFHGVRSIGPPQTWLEAAQAYWAKDRPGQVLVGMQALAYWKLPLPARLVNELAGPLTLAVASNRAAPRGRGVQGRRIRADLLTSMSRDGICVASPELALLTVMPKLTLRERVMCVDAAITRSRSYPGLDAVPLRVLGTIQNYAQRTGAAAGGGALREAVSLAREGVDSPPESILRVALIEAGLPEPQIQHKVFDHDGRLRAVLDLAYRGAKIDIEYDGDQHRIDRAQWQRDIQRARWLNAPGWYVIRVSSDDLKSRLPEIMALVARLLEERTPRHAPPPPLTQAHAHANSAQPVRQ